MTVEQLTKRLERYMEGGPAIQNRKIIVEKGTIARRDKKRTTETLTNIYTAMRNGEVVAILE